jgi:hypothetical protein
MTKPLPKGNYKVLSETVKIELDPFLWVLAKDLIAESDGERVFFYRVKNRVKNAVWSCNAYYASNNFKFTKLRNYEAREFLK